MEKSCWESFITPTITTNENIICLNFLCEKSRQIFNVYYDKRFGIDSEQLNGIMNTVFLTYSHCNQWKYLHNNEGNE